MNASPFLTIQEVADLLRVEYHTIWRRVKEGEIPAVRFGRAVRIHKDTLKLFITGGQPTAPAERADKAGEMVSKSIGGYSAE